MCRVMDFAAASVLTKIKNNRINGELEVVKEPDFVTGTDDIVEYFNPSRIKLIQQETTLSIDPLYVDLSLKVKAKPRLLNFLTGPVNVIPLEANRVIFKQLNNQFNPNVIGIITKSIEQHHWENSAVKTHNDLVTIVDSIHFQKMYQLV